MSEKNPQHDPEKYAEEARAAAASDPEFADTDVKEHDPYAHLRPYQFRPGESGNPKGRPAGMRTLARRFRQAGTLRPADIKAFGKIAKGLGIPDEALKGMDLMDLLAVSTYLHAVSGKGAALAQVSRTLTGTVRYTPNDSASKTRDDYRADAMRFYEAVLASEDISIKEKLMARARLDAIQGLLDDNNTMGAEELADEIRGFLDSADGSVPNDDENEEDEDEPSADLEAARVDEV